MHQPAWEQLELGTTGDTAGYDDEVTTSQLLVTIPVAARMLGLGRTTVYELIGVGDLEVVHIGRAARVPVEAVRDFVGRLREERASA
ncbi:MAG: helix-turn-helix domain-containing protein [Acidimicrobiales bacterium]